MSGDSYKYIYIYLYCLLYIKCREIPSVSLLMIVSNNQHLTIKQKWYQYDFSHHSPQRSNLSYR